MAFRREVNDGGAVVTFDGGLTVYEAAAIRDELIFPTHRTTYHPRRPMKATGRRRSPAPS